MSIQKSIDEAVEKVHAELAKNKLAQKEIAALKAGNAELVECLSDMIEEIEDPNEFVGTGRAKGLIAKHGSKE